MKSSREGKSPDIAPNVAVAVAKLNQSQRLLRLLERQLPANPNDPRNEKGVDKIEKVMIGYFDALYDSLPMGKLEAIYKRNVEEE